MSAFPKIIGLAGVMGSGKDTAAAYLVDIYKYTRVAFADGVREEALWAITAGSLPRSSPDDIFLALRNSSAEEVYAKPTTARMRSILQWWGTEYRRAQDPWYWLKYAERQMKEIQARDMTAAFAFSDVRFANEAEMIHRLGGVVWQLVGRGGGAQGIASHSSETLEGIQPDRTINNAGRLEDLYYQIDEALSGEMDMAA